MEPDGDLPRRDVVADPLDNLLYRLDLLGAIHPFPLGGIRRSGNSLAEALEAFLESSPGMREVYNDPYF